MKDNEHNQVLIMTPLTLTDFVCSQQQHKLLYSLQYFILFGGSVWKTKKRE